MPEPTPELAGTCRPPKGAAGTIRLPNTRPRNKQTFVRILTEVSADAWNGAGFAGSIHRPGAEVPAEVLKAHPVLLEHAGHRPAEKDHLWLLWVYHWDTRAWKELARAVASDWHWAVVLRPEAIRALEPRREAVDPRDHAGEVLEEMLQSLDLALSRELPAVRKLVLIALYDRVCARLVRSGK